MDVSLDSVISHCLIFRVEWSGVFGNGVLVYSGMFVDRECPSAGSVCDHRTLLGRGLFVGRECFHVGSVCVQKLLQGTGVFARRECLMPVMVVGRGVLGPGSTTGQQCLWGRSPCGQLTVYLR